MWGLRYAFHLLAILRGETVANGRYGKPRYHRRR